MEGMASGKAALLIVIAAAIFATNGLYVRLLPYPVEVIATVRLFFGALALGLYFKWRGKSLKIEGWGKAKCLLGAAIFNALAFYTNFTAYAFTSIATATVLLYTSPLFAVAIEKFAFKERSITKRNWLAVGLGMAGVGIIALGQGLGGTNALGLALGLASGLTYAMTMIATKRCIQTNGYERTAFYYILFAGVLLAPFAWAARPVLTLESLGWLALFGIVNSCIGVSLLLKGLKSVKPHHAIILVSTEMVFAALYAALFLGEPLTFHVAAGGLLIAAAAYWTEKKK